MDQRKSLLALRETITDAQKYLIDSERFMRALSGSFDVLEIDEGTLGHCVGVSTTTVKRWRNGNSIPYHHARRPIYRFLLEQVNHVLDSNEGTIMTNDSNEPRASRFRLQRHNGVDLVTIDLETGKVTLPDPDLVDEAADLFWRSVRRLWESSSEPLRDLIARGGMKGEKANAGDLIFYAGTAHRTSPHGNGGNVLVYPDSGSGPLRVHYPKSDG